MIDYKGGNGSSKEEAIIILEASNEVDGVNAEYDWLEEEFGSQNISWELNDQQLIDKDDRQYDVMKIKLSSGELKELWFDITEFYGK